MSITIKHKPITSSDSATTIKLQIEEQATEHTQRQFKNTDQLKADFKSRQGSVGKDKKAT